MTLMSFVFKLVSTIVFLTSFFYFINQCFIKFLVYKNLQAICDLFVFVSEFSRFSSVTSLNDSMSVLPLFISAIIFRSSKLLIVTLMFSIVIPLFSRLTNANIFW